jgi:hypothetical protein
VRRTPPSPLRQLHVGIRTGGAGLYGACRGGEKGGGGGLPEYSKTLAPAPYVALVMIGIICTLSGRLPTDGRAALIEHGPTE